MAEKERITNPSMGSNELGDETSEEVSTGISAGTDTQLMITVLGGKKHKKDENINDDESVVKKVDNESEFVERR